MYPNAGKGALHVYIPQMPELTHQSSCVTRLSVKELPDLKAESVTETGPEKRPFLRLRIPNENGLLGRGITPRLEYDLTYRTRDINRAPTLSVTPLTQAEQTICLAATPTVNFSDKAFTKWLDEKKYRRSPEENTLDFGWRIFDQIARTFQYGGENKDYEARCAARVCVSGQSDCGGLSILFTAIMRANGIPARPLFGRWGITQKGDYAQFHVIAEFFVGNMGWVPVDLAGTILHKPQPPYFGKTDPNTFLTFHTGTDLIPAPHFQHGWAQYMLLQWKGEGDFWRDQKVSSQWTVT